MVTDQGAAEGEQVMAKFVLTAVSRQRAGIAELARFFGQQARVFALGIRKRWLGHAQTRNQLVERVNQFAFSISF